MVELYHSSKEGYTSIPTLPNITSNTKPSRLAYYWVIGIFP